MSCTVAVLISGNGSNLQAILDHAKQPQAPFEVGVVVSNHPDAFGLQRAAQAKIACHVVDHRKFAKRQDFEQQMLQTLADYQPDLVVLAGFMRILTPFFIEQYQGRLLNIHPALLPAYKGLHTHQRVLADGAREHGATVHFVVPQLDAGPTIIQARVPVLPNDTVDSLAKRVLVQEHRIYPLAISWFAQGRLRLQDNRAWLDNQPLFG